MVDVERVCCMCGDVGFPDKIFRCINCHHRFQHSYCSNYYSSSESSSELPERCDWCQTEVIRGATKPGGCSKKSSSKTEYSGSKIKQAVHDHHREEAGSHEKGKLPWSAAGAPSPKTSTRRYKLLKDVMC